MARPPVILDAYGRPARMEIEDIPRPDRLGDWHVPPQRLSQGITPQSITTILGEADAGDPRQQAELFQDSMLKDGRILGAFRQRTMAVSKLPIELESATDDASDKKVLEWLRPRFERIKMRQPLRRLMKAVGFGYAAEQIHWRIRDDGVEVADITHWPTRYLLPDADGKITRICTAADPVGEDMPPAKFIVHLPEEADSDAVAAGLFRTAVWYWFFKNWGLKAWLQYMEIYGQPLRWGTFPQGAKPEDKSYAYNALLRMGHEAVALLPEHFKLEIHDTAHTGGADLYEKLLRLTDEEIAVLFLGQTLTTSVGETGGAFAAAQVHDEVRWDLVESDAEIMADTLRRDLITPWVRYQFGQEVEIPNVVIHAREPEDLKQTVEVHRTLIKDIGLPVSRRYLYDHYGVPEPTDDEDVLPAPTGQAGAEPPPAAPNTARHHDPHAIAAKEGTDDPGEPRRPAGDTLSAELLSWMR